MSQTYLILNSKYCYPSDFEKLTLSSSATNFFSIHIILNSLNAHLGDLQTTLASLNFDFHVIGASETRENFNTGFKMNVDLDGFTQHSQSSRSGVSCVAIYTSRSPNAFKKTYQSVVDDEFETKLWILKLKTSFAVVPIVTRLSIM